MADLFDTVDDERQAEAAIVPRPYQYDAIGHILKAWQEHDSTLAVLATGLGKTVIAANVIANRRDSRTIFVAHRDELIWQAVKTIERVTGERPAVEMANHWSDEAAKARCVVTSVQTQCSGKLGGRMGRFDHNEFGTIIIDEAHHAAAETYRRVINYYRQNDACRVLGITATPDRGDKKALGLIFQHVAFEYDIFDAVKDGWLVRPRQFVPKINELDLSHVGTVAGDFNQGQLDTELRKSPVVAKMCVPIIDHAKSGRLVLAFTASIEHAQLLTDTLNGQVFNCARFVCGETPKDERRQMFADYKARKFNVLCNVGVATEGFDEPGIDVVAIGRPTKSRALYCQMIGRGTRPLAGVVDGLETPADRQRSIAASTKTHLEVLDFKGNAGKHRLAGPADVLGGNYEDEVVQRARKQIDAASAKGRPADVMDELEKAKAAIAEERRRKAERRAKVRVAGSWERQEIDPFDPMASRHQPYERNYGTAHATEPQLRLLRKFKHPEAELADMTKQRASQIIADAFRRREQGLSSPAQVRLLGRYGIDAGAMSWQAAKTQIDAIATNGWKLPAKAAPVERPIADEWASAPF